MNQSQIIQRRIRQGSQQDPADLVITNIRLLDLVTGKLIESEIAICDSMIVGTYGSFKARHVIDGKNRIAVPGFIDTHLHVESSLVTPAEFDRCVLPHGVTTAICDPHEMANVLGTAAFDYFLEAADTLLMDLRVNLSSCVPATWLETSGARLDAIDLAKYIDHPKVIGLAEFMNFPGVVGGDAVCLEKLVTFAHRHIDGHAPLLRGDKLNGYISAGIRTDHEATTADEALEKIRKGMTILIREGSVCKDLRALAPLLTPETSSFLAFCTDDRNPLEIDREGHIDFLIRSAISQGVAPVAAYRAASLSAATAFGLRDRGILAPGKRADIVLLDDLYECRVSQVFSAGRVVDDALFSSRKLVTPIGLNSVKLAHPMTGDDFAVPGDGDDWPVIGIIPGQIITRSLRRTLISVAGSVKPDVVADIAKVCVVARHGHNDNIGRGFVTGFGLARGAMASSGGHGRHNICVVGHDDADMAYAVNRLATIGGGYVVVHDQQVLGELSLPIAGLMSDKPFEEVCASLLCLEEAVQRLGVGIDDPFLQLAFLPLPVIPHLKISDRGIIDVDRMVLL